MGAVASDYGKVIKDLSKEIEKLIKGKAWDDNAVLTQIFDIYREAIYQQVHYYLVPQKTDKSEKAIRDTIAKYVIGYTDKAKKVNYIGAIAPIRAKIAQISRGKRVNQEHLARYLELYDDFMALASFRSMKHYFLYMQQVFNFTLWEDTLNCFEGYFYYGGKMILDGEICLLEKQCPTGFGKSVSDAFMQSWTFGINIDARIFKVCGNDKITDDCFNNLVSLMLSRQFAKVFPYYEKFECQKDKLFAFCAAKDGVFKINGSKQPKNFLICTKNSDTNGVRCDYLYLDDITQRRDMANITMHEKDIHSFTHEWLERRAKDDYFGVIASGTTYSQFDILSHIRRKGGGENAVKSPVNKYTSVAKSDFIKEGTLSVFVCVPLLDYETDESTYPKKISTFKARKKREESPTEFWAMDMQKPLPPESSPFYFTKLRQYETLPAIGECNRTDTCVGVLDTKRRGKDFLSMPIFFEADDPEREGQSAFFLVDWLYDDRPMKDLIPFIVSKIIQHKITRFLVERNTEECIETLLQDKLRERGYTSCVIEEVYSTEPKDRRIMAAEGDMKSKIIYPKYGLYAPSNDIGKAMMNVYGYSYTGTNAHDDAPDSLALFAKRFIMNATQKYAKVSTFRR